MTLDPIITSAITSIISGIFIGLGIAVGFYQALKRQMPQWIHSFRMELLTNNAIDKAVTARKGYA